MTEHGDTRAQAVARLDAARDARVARSDALSAARGSVTELDAHVALDAADEQLAAREAWVAWLERDY